MNNGTVLFSVNLGVLHISDKINKNNFLGDEFHVWLSVVHCAAQRFPDKLEADYEQSVALNVASTGWLGLATKEVRIEYNGIFSLDNTVEKTWVNYCPITILCVG